MQRVLVVGNSGSGKTTMARHLAARLGGPHLELDSVFHQPGWTELPEVEFRARVAEFVAGDTWVVDGNYSAVADLVVARADTVVWMDLPRSVVMRQLIRRTASRGFRRTELWNGNRETLSNFFRLDPERSIVRWAWTQHDVCRTRYEEALSSGAWDHLEVVRLTTPPAIRAFAGGNPPVR